MPARPQPEPRRDTIPVELEWLEFVEEKGAKGAGVLVPRAPRLPPPIPAPRPKAPPPLPTADKGQSKRHSLQPKTTSTKTKKKKS